MRMRIYKSIAIFTRLFWSDHEATEKWWGVSRCSNWATIFSDESRGVRGHKPQKRKHGHECKRNTLQAA